MYRSFEARSSTRKHNVYMSTTYQLTYVSLICKAVGAAAARAAKVAALFRSSLNIHNQFSQVSWLALAWPRVLYVYV